jgi:hypothetical protein
VIHQDSPSALQRLAGYESAVPFRRPAAGSAARPLACPARWRGGCRSAGMATVLVKAVDRILE